MLYTIKCPSCGAALKIAKEETDINCDYCGSSLINHLPDHTNVNITYVPSNPITPEPIQKEEKVESPPAGVGTIIIIAAVFSIPATLAYLYGTAGGFIGLIIAMIIFYTIVQVLERRQKKSK